MEDKEFVPGDWIKRCNEYLRVISVNHLSGEVFLDQDGRGVTEKLSNIEPVPLTVDILERNNIPRRFDNLWKMDEWKNDSLRLWIGSDGYILGDIYGKKGKNTQTHVYSIFTYVHELQHAIAVCNAPQKIKL